MANRQKRLKQFIEFWTLYQIYIAGLCLVCSVLLGWPLLLVWFLFQPAWRAFHDAMTGNTTDSPDSHTQPPQSP